MLCCLYGVVNRLRDDPADRPETDPGGGSGKDERNALHCHNQRDGGIFLARNDLESAPTSRTPRLPRKADRATTHMALTWESDLDPRGLR